jgi:hypothetical protein
LQIPELYILILDGIISKFAWFWKRLRQAYHEWGKNADK